MKECKHGFGGEVNEIGEKLVFCEISDNLENVTLGSCLGNCESQEPWEIEDKLMKTNIIKNGSYNLSTTSCKNDSSYVSIPTIGAAEGTGKIILASGVGKLGHKSIYELIREAVEK